MLLSRLTPVAVVYTVYLVRTGCTRYTLGTRYTLRMEGPLMSVREFRASVGRRIDEAYFHEEPTIVSKNGERRAALIPYSWLEELERRRAADPAWSEAPES